MSRDGRPAGRRRRMRPDARLVWHDDCLLRLWRGNLHAAYMPEGGG